MDMAEPGTREQKPIFYDEKRRRWKRLRRILDISAAVGLLTLIVFVLGVLGLAIWTLRLRIKLTSPTPPARQGRPPALVLDHADFEALTQAQGREPPMLAVPPGRLSSFGDPS